MVRQVAVGKRIHSPGANEHRTRCCSGHPGMVQAAAPGAYRPTENALMGFRHHVCGTTSLRCGGPDTMCETGHRLVFHHAIIHENRFTVVKKLLCPLHLRMPCPKSVSFCNKRAFMWLFMKPVSYRAEERHGHSTQAALPLTPTDVFALYLLPSARFRQLPSGVALPHLPCHFRGLCWGRSPRVPRFIC